MIIVGLTFEVLICYYSIGWFNPVFELFVSMVQFLPGTSFFVHLVIFKSKFSSVHVCMSSSLSSKAGFAGISQNDFMDSGEITLVFPGWQSDYQEENSCPRGACAAF